jgi:magnesium transporter
MIKKYEIINYTLAASESDDSPVQVYINPDAEEKKLLCSAYHIDEHNLTSALDPDEISRIEFDEDHTFLIWKRPTNYSAEEQFLFNVSSVGFFLFEQRLLVVIKDDLSLFGSGFKAIAKLNSITDILMNSLYFTIHHFLEHLKVIKLISRELQQKINTSMENAHLIQMFNLSESLVYYLNAINANNVVLVKLRNHIEKTGSSPEIVELLDDIIIENNQCYKPAEIYSTIFSGLMDARGSLVNNNMNVLLRKLTIINVVFLPLNLIASIFGMSEYSMITSAVNWQISYSLFLLAMLLIGWFTAYSLGRLSFSKNSERKARSSVWNRVMRNRNKRELNNLTSS